MRRVKLARSTVVTIVTTEQGKIPPKRISGSMSLVQDSEVAVHGADLYECRDREGGNTIVPVTTVMHFMPEHGWEPMELVATGPLAPEPPR